MKQIWMFYAAETRTGTGMQRALQIAGDPDSDEPMQPEYEGWHRGFVAVRGGSEVDIRSR